MVIIYRLRQRSISCMECSLGFSEFLSGTPLHVAEVTSIWIGRARSICLEQPWQNYAIFMVIFFYFLGKSIPCVDGSFHIFCFFFGTYLHVVEAGCNWTFYANVSGLQQTLQKGVFLIIIPIFCFEQDTLFQEQSLDIFLRIICLCLHTTLAGCKWIAYADGIGQNYFA